MIFGYLEPGTGSLILQAALAGTAGIAVAFKAWKARLSSRKAIAEAGATAQSETAAEETPVNTES